MDRQNNRTNHIISHVSVHVFRQKKRRKKIKTLFLYYYGRNQMISNGCQYRVRKKNQCGRQTEKLERIECHLLNARNSRAVIRRERWICETERERCHKFLFNGLFFSFVYFHWRIKSQSDWTKKEIPWKSNRIRFFSLYFSFLGIVRRKRFIAKFDSSHITDH